MKRNTIVCLLGLAMYSQVQAAPDPYTKEFGALRIENPTTSVLMRDSEDAKRVWVRPPSTGAVSIKSFHASGNIGFCDGLRSLYRASNSTAKKIAQVTEQSLEALERVKEANKEVANARRMLGELQSKPAASKMLSLNSQLSDTQDRMAVVAEQLDQCQEACEGLMAEYEDLRDESKALRKEMRELRAANRELFSKVSRAENRLTQAEEIRNEVTEPYDRIVAKLIDYRGRLFNMFANEAKLEGGFVSIDYATGWSKAVQTLQSLYPQYGFEKIQTYDVKVNIHPIATGGTDLETYYNSLPMLLSYTVAGLPFLPTGEIKNELQAIPDTIAGDFRLSLIGACPRADADFFDGIDVKPDLDTTGLPKFAMTLEYSYPAVFKYKVAAKYNLYKMYELVKKQKKKGGFFSTKSYKSISESNVSTDTFEIDWKSEDPDEHISPEERTKIATTFKKNLLDRILKAMATPVYKGGAAKPEEAGVPPTNGAIVLGNGVWKACPMNVYCKVGGWILKGLGSVFGSSSSETRFKTESNFTATEKWSSEQARLQPDVVSFER